jgi:3'(2'), 5'-bisphosphate nucleotidase
MNPETLQAPLCEIARAAGAAILRVYATEFEVRRKSDQSPVTDADVQAEGIIVGSLNRLTPGIDVVSEESASESAPPAVGNRFWLVDPLDGTREFVRRNGEFTVNIALIEHGRPVLGLIYAPVLERLYVGSEQAGASLVTGGRRHPISCRPPPAGGLAVITSRWHSDPAPWSALLRGRAVATHTTMGSSLKFAMVASGQADIYPRQGRTWEWDTAAGQAILAAAGGRVTDAKGVDLAYGKEGFVNPSFIASGLDA